MTYTPKNKRPPFVVVQNGSWYLVRSFPSGEIYENGRKRYIQIKRKCEPETWERAAELADEIAAAWEREITAAAEPMSLGRLVERYLSAKQGAVERATYEFYDAIHRRMIKGRLLASAPVDSITASWLQDEVDQLKQDGISAKNIKNLRTFLVGVFNQARRWGIVTGNPAVDVIVPRHRRKPIAFMDEAEAKRFLVACRDHPAGTVFHFALETFLRPGEYLALQWPDVDTEAGTVSVTRAIATGFEAGGYEFKEPKTRGSRRVIDISPEMCRLLEEHRAKQLAELEELQTRVEAPVLLEHKKAKGVNYARRLRARRTAQEAIRNHAKHNLVFPASNGMPQSRMNLGRRELREVLEAAGLGNKGINLYSLRHTGVTLSIGAGGNIKAVSEKAGHATVTFTMNTYGHVLPSMRREATSKFAEMLYER